MFLGIEAGGIAFTPSATEFEQRLVHLEPLAEPCDGVACYQLAGRSDYNWTVSQFLGRPVYGDVAFAAVSAGGPSPINEVALEALGWAVARSVIAGCEKPCSLVA